MPRSVWHATTVSPGSSPRDSPPTASEWVRQWVVESEPYVNRQRCRRPFARELQHTGAADHFPADQYSLCYTDANPLDATVEVSASDSAAQTLIVARDAGGAEEAD